MSHTANPNELLEVLGDELGTVVRDDPGPRVGIPLAFGGLAFVVLTMAAGLALAITFIGLAVIGLFAIIQSGIMPGKLNGGIPATTPNGSRIE